MARTTNALARIRSTDDSVPFRTGATCTSFTAPLDDFTVNSTPFFTGRALTMASRVPDSTQVIETQMDSRSGSALEVRSTRSPVAKAGEAVSRTRTVVRSGRTTGHSATPSDPSRRPVRQGASTLQVPYCAWQVPRTQWRSPHSRSEVQRCAKQTPPAGPRTHSKPMGQVEFAGLQRWVSQRWSAPQVWPTGHGLALEQPGLQLVWPKHAQGRGSQTPVPHSASVRHVEGALSHAPQRGPGLPGW